MIEIFNNLNIDKSQYFLTGSRALSIDEFVCHTSESDYDYVTLITNRHHIINYLNNSNIAIYPSNYNGGFKFNYDGKLINVITPINVEFMAWREALSILQLLFKTDDVYKKVIKNKFSRYCAYEQLRGLIKSIINFANIEGK